jgi:hypothetical protein
MPLTDPVIVEIVTDRLQKDARQVALLSQTCRPFRDGFPTTYEMHDLADWLIWQEQLENSTIEAKSRQVFTRAQISYSGQRRTWVIKAQGGRQSSEWNHVGVIRLGKCSATLTILGETEWTMHKDSFYGVDNLQTLHTCMLSHVALCHEMPEIPHRLPEKVVHRHRDSVPWTVTHAFHKWSSSGLRRRGTSRQDCVVDMAHRTIFFSD